MRPPRPTLPHKIRAEQQEARRSEELARLDKVVETSSEKNRNFFTATLALLIYVQAIVFSTTDLQLLVSSEGLKLPIVDLSVPLVGFYLVVPLLVIALHFNLLQNLDSHHHKLLRWRDAHPDGTVPRSRLWPFLFDYATLERGGQFQRLVRFANGLLCYEFAPITLGLLLIRFSDRQDFAMTAWHCACFVFDVWLLWKMGLALEDNHRAAMPPTAGWRDWLVMPWRFVWDTLRRPLRAVVVALVLLETGVAYLIAGTSNDVFVADVLPRVLELSRSNYRSVEWLLPRLAIKPTETVWQPDVKALETAAKLAGQTDWVKYFNERGEGFRPATNSLRLLRMPEQKLPHAQLKSARLQGADLERAQMQGAFLSEAQMQDAYLERAQMQGAFLAKAGMQGANLMGARMQGANLLLAEMQRADLLAAQMQGSDLRGALMQAVDLTEAEMQGAVLSLAEMQGAILEKTRMQGADLSGAGMQGAHLLGAQMRGSDLSRAQMQGAVLGTTALQGALAVPQAAVYGIDGKDRLFDPAPGDWNSLEKLADAIPVPQRRDAYLRRIRQAAQSRSTVTETGLHHDPRAIAKTALPKLCGKTYLPHTARQVATNAFCKSYVYLFKLHPTHDQFEQPPEYQSLLQDIDRQLCTLPECADLRDGIKGLDCKPYTPAPAQPQAKP